MARRRLNRFQAPRLCQLCETHQAGEWHQLTAALRADVKTVQIGGGDAVIALRLQYDVVLFACLDEGRDLPGAHHRLERGSDLLGAHAEVCCPRLINFYSKLRPRLLVVRVRIEQSRVLRHARQHEVAPLRQLGIVGTAEH